jgi:hypothetical protein
MWPVDWTFKLAAHILQIVTTASEWFVAQFPRIEF